jgi:hypothetical protein
MNDKSSDESLTTADKTCTEIEIDLVTPVKEAVPKKRGPTFKTVPGQKKFLQKKSPTKTPKKRGRKPKTPIAKKLPKLRERSMKQRIACIEDPDFIDSESSCGFEGTFLQFDCELFDLLALSFINFPLF